MVLASRSTKARRRRTLNERGNAMTRNRSSMLIMIGAAVFVLGASLAFLALRSDGGGKSAAQVKARHGTRRPDRRGHRRRRDRSDIRDSQDEAGLAVRCPMSLAWPSS